MNLETGQLSELHTADTGWVIGFSDWTRSEQLPPGLRHIPKGRKIQNLCVKWMCHLPGDPRGTGKPPSEGTTISILVAGGGPFRLQFSDAPDFRGRVVEHTLARPGDYSAWGPGLHHRWFVDDACTLLTIRWEDAGPETVPPA